MIHFILPQLMGATTNSKWFPGIGDPSLLGWFTVIAYFSTAILCLGCAVYIHRALSTSWHQTYSRFWWGVAGALFVLGFNKQLDLQTLVTVVGRDIAKSWGWYGARRVIQAIFIFLLASGGLFAFYTFISNSHQVWKRNKLACIGLAFLSIFILSRAASFHHVDTLINFTVEGIRMNWILELGGIACIAISCCTTFYSVLRNKRNLPKS